MFGLFKKKLSQNPSGAELAMKGLQSISYAASQNIVKFERGRIFPDIYVHADAPEGMTRVSYVIFSPTDQTDVIARCAIVLNRAQHGITIWQVDWAVSEAHRNKGYGTAVARKAIEEFKSGMAGKMSGGFALEAVVEPSNAKSNHIANKLIGNCEQLVDPGTGESVNNYLVRIRD